MHFPSHHTVLALTALTPFASASPRAHPKSTTGKAVYAITNNQDNAVIALPIQADGKLGKGVLTSTMGKGDAAVDAMGQPALNDVLGSQSALTVAGQYIFAVNAGSNTVSMLAISSHDPTKLRVVGTPAAVMGTFPNTVAASLKNSMVCVGTTGSRAGVSCGSFDKRTGIGGMKQISQFNLKQTDPPSVPLNTVSQTLFSADEMMLYTLVKGNPMVNNTGFLSSVPVRQAGNGDCEPMIGQEVRSSPAGTAVLFGSDVIPGSNPPKIFSTDASFGAAILTLDNTGKAVSATKGVIEGQKATCWSTLSSVTHSAWVTDGAINRLVEMSLTNASTLSVVDLSQTVSGMNLGMIDLRAAGNFLYALSPGNGTLQPAISVFDVVSKKVVQNAELGALGVRNTTMGMAVLM